MKKLFFILIITFLPTLLSAGVWYEPLTGNLMSAPKAEDIEYGSTTVKAGIDAAVAGAGANALGYYLLTRSTNAPTNGVNLGGLSTGLLKITVTGGVATPSVASAGVDYLTPTGNGAGLSGITAIQVGAAAASHAHSGADITSGTVGISYLPTGATDTTVALGNHTHSSVYQPLDWANPVAVTDTATLTLGKHHVVTVTSADKTLTLPAVSGNGGKLISIEIVFSTTKLITLDGNESETIDGTATRIMWAGESAILLCNGTSWTKIAGKSIPMSGILSKSNGNLLFTVSTLTIIPFDTSDVSLAAMVTIGSYQLNIVRAGKYDIYGSINYSTNNSDNSLSSAVVGFNGVTGVMSNHSQLPGYNTSATQIKFGHSLNIGDYLTLHGRVTGTFTTSTINPNATPYLMIQEVPTW